MTREFIYPGIKNLIYLIAAEGVCMIFLFFSALPEKLNPAPKSEAASFFEKVDPSTKEIIIFGEKLAGEAIAAIFVLSCASILIGLMISVNMICRDYDIIRRELRSGITARTLSLSKTIVLFLLCLGMSFILIIPYILQLYGIPDQYTFLLFGAVFITMFVSSSLGLLISAVWRNKPPMATFSITFVLLYQILFSGFIFEENRFDLRFLNSVSISNYSIKAIGHALRFDRSSIAWYISPRTYTFIDDFMQAFGNFAILMIFFGICLIASIRVLYLVDKKGGD
jgi:hypothetical protein